MDTINLHNNADLAAYVGIPSFMRQRVTRDCSGADVAIVGVPFDTGATSNRSGSRFGPRKIREASLLLWGFNRHFGITPLELLNVVDYGDVVVDSIRLEESMHAITADVDTILSAGATVIALGGDHSISLSLLRAHAKRFGPLAMIHFDSHVDTEQDSLDHGTVFRHAIAEGLIDTSAWVQVGIRGPVACPEEVEGSKDLGALVLGIDDCFSLGIPGVLQAIHSRIGDRPAYVSLDIDAVDPAYAPGTGTPEVGGLSSYQMLQLVRGLRGLDLVGFDLVEVCPPYDVADITSILAANLVFEFLSLLALRAQAAHSLSA